MKASRVLFVAAMSLLAGCTITYRSDVTFHDVPCKSLHGWCVIALPGADLAVRASAYTADRTDFLVRLAPRDGVVAQWSSAEVELLDLESGKTSRFKVLDTQPVAGRKLLPNIGEELWVLYGPYSEASLRVAPRAESRRLQFPPVILSGKEVTVPPIRVHDGARVPVPFFYHSH